MFLSKRKNGYYYVWYIKDGRKNAISTKKTSKKEAQKFLSDLQKNLHKKNIRKIDNVNRLSDFTDKYIAYSKGLHKEKYTQAINNTFNILKRYCTDNAFLGDLTPQRIRNYIQFRIESASVYQARKDLIILKSAFNWAVEMNLIIENPAAKIKAIRIPEKQPKFFSWDEYKRLLKKIDTPSVRDIVIVAVNTGLRESELLKLTWKQVDFNYELLYIDNQTHLSKSSRVRTVPINSKCRAVLKRQKRNGNFVFTIRDKEISADWLTRSFKKCVLSADLDKAYNFHTLRHTFASWLVQRGVSIYIVSKLLGHASVKTTEIYSHLIPDAFNNAVSKL